MEECYRAIIIQDEWMEECYRAIITQDEWMEECLLQSNNHTGRMDGGVFVTEH